MSFCLGGETEASGQSQHAIRRNAWGLGRRGYLLWDCDQQSHPSCHAQCSTAWGQGGLAPTCLWDP